MRHIASPLIYGHAQHPLQWQNPRRGGYCCVCLEAVSVVECLNSFAPWRSLPVSVLGRMAWAGKPAIVVRPAGNRIELIGGSIGSYLYVWIVCKDDS